MVEWKELGQLGKFENIGTDKKINEGEKLVTLLNYVDVYHHKYIDSSIPQMQVSASDKKIVDCSVEQGDIFVTPSSETVDDIGHSSIITETIPNAVYSYHIMRYRLFVKNMLLSYYINYAFDTNFVKKQILKKAQGLTRFGLSIGKFSSIQIPIPSIPEQTRIVEILDTFVASICNIKEQIALRRKQYEHYRDELLDIKGNEGEEMKTIGEVGVFVRGSGIQKTDFVEDGYGCIHYGQIHTKYGLSATETISKIGKSLYDRCKKAHKGDVILATTSEDAEGCAKPVAWLGNEVIAIGSDTLIYHHNQNGKYMAHQFLTHRFMLFKIKHAIGAKVVRIPAEKIAKFKVPVPSLEEQGRIVSILDTFEASIANLEAQLELREKQYDYYRNKLLTFE